MVTTDDHALNVRLPSDLYEQLRRHAFEARRSQSEVVRDALKRYFERGPDERSNG